MEGEVDARSDDVAEGDVRSTVLYSTLGMFPDREKHVPTRRMVGLVPSVDAREDVVARPSSPVDPVMRIVVVASIFAEWAWKVERVLVQRESVVMIVVMMT